MERLIRALDAGRMEAEAAERAAAAMRAEADRQEAERRARAEGERAVAERAKAEREAQETARQWERATPPAAETYVPPPPPFYPMATEVCVVGHGTLLFWWPVWIVSLVNGLLSLFSNVSGANLGVLFLTVVLLVIGITTVRLRDILALAIIGVVIVLTVVFAFFGWWDKIFEGLGFLEVRINAVTYFVIAAVLFVPWLVVTLFIDRHTYILFTPGQIRVCIDHDGELAFDTTGMTVEKVGGDLFRHRVLGFGSGDLVIRTAGACGREFRFANVLFIGTKMKAIQRVLMTRPG
jgi:hypothetical protein